MRIGIDARFYGPSSKGLGRYSQKLIENLEKVSNAEDEFFVFLRKENWDDYQPQNPRFKKALADFPWYSLAEQWRMPILLNQYELDLVHFPHFNVPLFYRRPYVVTIHDLILIHFPTLRATTLNPVFYWFKFLAYKIVIKSAIKRARSIIAVSRATKNDILKNYPVSPEKISVTYEATDIPSRLEATDGEKVLEKYGIIKPYLLYVGNAYPHKNLEKLTIGFQKALQKRLNLFLVLVGKKDYFYNQLIEKVKEKNFQKIIFTGHVTDQELEAIYQNTEAYIFPSLYEGFGLPPLEAMARNVPVISSDYESMREVLGNGAHFFDAHKSENISKAILEVVANEQLKNELREKGSQLVKKYSWFKMAAQTFEVYHQTKK